MNISRLILVAALGAFVVSACGKAAVVTEDAIADVVQARVDAR